MFFLRELPTRKMIGGITHALPGFDPDAVLLRLDDLRRASLRLRRIEAFLAGHGLSQTQFLVIMVIVREPERATLTPGEIAERLDVSRPVLSKALATMERSGLIARNPDKADARRAGIAPTDAGRARFDALLPGYFEALMADGPQVPRPRT